MPTSSSPTALLVIDMQVAVVDGALDRSRVIDNINALAARCRQAGAPVVWIQNENVRQPEMTAGAPGWQIVPELDRGEGDPVVHKNYRDSFADTDLAAVLEKTGTTRLLVTGAATSYCVQTTAMAAVLRGYDLTLVGDAHTGRGHLLTTGELVPPELLVGLVNSQFANMSYPDRTIEVRATADVVI